MISLRPDVEGPEFMAVIGVRSIIVVARVLGRESRYGWWYYFPVVFFYRSPLPWLILVALGAMLSLRDAVRMVGKTIRLYHIP